MRQYKEGRGRGGELRFAVAAWARMSSAGSEVLAKLILPSTAGELLFRHAEAGEEAGGSGGPAFPAGTRLKLTLGMWDKHGATGAACPQN